MIAHFIEYHKLYAAGAQMVAAIALLFAAWQLRERKK